MPKRKRSRPVTAPDSLPPPNCSGPSLRAFRPKNPQIEWLDRLDDNREDGSGTEGYVFKVRIKSQVYALKVFKFYEPSTTEYYWGPLLGASYPREDVAYYMDPFYAECRAYGRIRDTLQKPRWGKHTVVPCYGFIYLQDHDREMLEKERGCVLEAEDENGDIIPSDLPVRAILKEFIPGEGSGVEKGIGRALQRIRLLNKQKIYNRDIRADNFKDGRLVDFGSSLTEPHAILDAMSEWEASGEREGDLVRFDQMIEQENLRTHIRAMPSVKFRMRLRNWES